MNFMGPLLKEVMKSVLSTNTLSFRLVMLLDYQPTSHHTAVATAEETACQNHCVGDFHLKLIMVRSIYC